MPPREFSHIGMPAAPADFADTLTHRHVLTTKTVKLSYETGESDGYTPFVDERGYIQCEMGPKEGDFRNFQLMQRNGTWTQVIPTVDKLPIVYREYLFHLGWLKQKEHVERSGDIKKSDFLSQGRDRASTMNFAPFLTDELIHAGKIYAEEMKFPGHIAICDASRQVEFYLDAHTFTPAYARIRLQDTSFSPPFVFSQLPPEWQAEAQQFFSSLSKENAAECIVTPERQKKFDVDTLHANIAQQNDTLRFRVFIVVGTSGIGKDTVVDRSLDWTRQQGIALRMRKTKSRVTDRKKRPAESAEDNIYVSTEEFERRAGAKELIHPYQSRRDDMYAYDPSVLLQELQGGNVTLTIANSDHYQGVYEDIRARLAALHLLDPVLVLIEKDTEQIHVSIEGRDADSNQKKQRIASAEQFQAGFRSDLALSQQNEDGPVLHTVINNYMMFDDSIERFLSIVNDHMQDEQ